MLIVQETEASADELSRSCSGIHEYSVLISVCAKEDAEDLRSSLNGIIRQTKAPEEILIVKDGPLTREIESVLGVYNASHPGLFTFIAYPENRGLWYALSVGVPACRNELIMRMDADDLSLSQRAEKELAVLEKRPEVGCVGSLVTEFVGDAQHPTSLVQLPETHEEILRFGKKRCPFRHPTLLFRKSAVMAAGNYQQMPMFEDYDLFMRMAASGCVFYNLQESLVWVRTGEDFFARRGSMDYLKKMLYFKSQCHRRGDLSLSEFIVSAVPHALVCVLPNRLRTLIYENLLRSPASDDGPRP